MKMSIIVAALLFLLMHSAIPVFGETDSALIYRQGLETIERTDSTAVSPELAELCSFLGRYSEFQLFKMKDAIRYQERALGIYLRLGDRHQAEISKIALGRLHISQGNIHKAYLYTSSAMNYLKGSTDTLNLRECFLLMEQIDYAYYHDSKRALEFNEMITCSDNPVAAKQKAKALNQQLVYAGSIQEADSLLQECRSICMKHDFPSMLLNTYLNCSLFCIGQSDLDRSRTYLEEARKYVRNFKDSGYYYAACGFYNIYEGNEREGIRNLKESIALLEQGDFDAKNMYSYYYLQQLYSKEGMYAEAYAALSRYMEIYSEMNSPELFRDLSASLFEAERNQLNERHYRENQKKTFLILTLVILSIFIIVVSFEFFSKQKIRIRAALLEKEKKDDQLKQKEEIIRLQKLQRYQESEFADGLIEELYAANEKNKVSEIKKDIISIIRKLNNSKDRSEWSEIETTTEGTSTVFFERLLKEHPDLTTNERRLCSLIHMNLTTKEISNITRQSVNSINVARTRLRKKLLLTGDEQSLVSYLDRFDLQEK